MNRKICLPIIFFATIVLAPQYLHAYKFGLGSCLHQGQEQAIWKAIKLKEVDSFIFLGDNVYGDTQSGNLQRMKGGRRRHRFS